MVKISLPILVALCLLAAPASAEEARRTADNLPASARVQEDRFLDLLKAGKSGDAVDSIFKGSSLWATKVGFREAMIGQIDSDTRFYGPVIAYELVDTKVVGTMVARDYVLVQHRDMVTRWEFDLVRTATGWQVGYFGFSDNPRDWF